MKKNGSGVCPKEKVLSKKCKGEKNNKKNKKDDKKESKKEKHGDNQGDYVTQLSYKSVTTQSTYCRQMPVY